MKIGVSTASLYPLYTEDALDTLGQIGVRCAEVFANAPCELTGVIFEKMLATKENYGIEVPSMHPFSSPMETLFLFTEYDRRVQGFLECYEEYFKSMNRIGAKVFVVHGAILSSKIDDSLYFRQFRRLVELGNRYGVIVAQENINYCKSASVDFLKRFSSALGEDAHFVLDIKQAIRSRVSPFDIVEAVGDKIVHCHVSDSNDEKDCLPVGKGGFNFKKLFTMLWDKGYNGAAMVELYRENYKDYRELYESAENLKEILANV